MKSYRKLLTVPAMVLASIFVAFASIGPDTSLTSSSASFLGEGSYDRSGLSIASAGDVNGDGYSDILIGAPLNDDNGNDAGKVYLIFGAPAPPLCTNCWFMDRDLSDADVWFLGEYDHDHAGCAVAGAGDVNGDGYDDILIGANQNDESADFAGQVYLIFGKSTGWSKMSLADADASFWGEAVSDFAGTAVSGAGDVNGDGYADFLVGAPDHDTGRGKSYLFFGKNSGWGQDDSLTHAAASFLGEAMLDEAGTALASAGDVNGDGYGDFLIAAPYNEAAGSDAGRAYLFLGKPAGWAQNTTLSLADGIISAEGSNHKLGTSLAGAGDVNGDGMDDFLLGAPFFSSTLTDVGKAYLFLGDSNGWNAPLSASQADASFMGEAAGDQAGSSLSMAGDVNGDGLDEILLGASENDGTGSDAGKVYLFYGRTAGWSADTDLATADASFFGEASGDRAGSAVALSADLNDDRYGDVLIAAVGSDSGGTNAGQTYVLLSDTSSTFAQRTRFFHLGQAPYTSFRSVDVGVEFKYGTAGTVTAALHMRPPYGGLFDVDTTLHHISELRQWEITSTRVGLSNITFHYRPPYDIIYEENNLTLAFRSDSTRIWTDWNSRQYKGVEINPENHTITAVNVDSSGYWALASLTDDNPLPVELLSFSAAVIENDVHLTWKTLSESANYGFVLERASEKHVFAEIGFVPGNGTIENPSHYEFLDENLTPGDYRYRLKQINNDGVAAYSGERIVRVELPLRFVLHQNFPNPVYAGGGSALGGNPETVIRYRLPVDGKVTLQVYNIRGRKVATLIDEKQSAGFHRVSWNASGLSCGLYIYTLSSGNFYAAKKALVAK